MSQTEVLILRHGETEWNRQGRIQGQLESELSALGQWQAEALARRLGAVELHALYSSDLGRAQASLAPLAQRLGQRVHLERGLRERHFGMLQGLLRDQAKRDHPEVYRGYKNDPAYVIPGGESMRQFAARSLETLGRVARSHPAQRVLVMTHGGVLRRLLKHVFNHPQDGHCPFQVHNASINVFHYDAGAWRLEVWGEVGHLAPPTDGRTL